MQGIGDFMKLVDEASKDYEEYRAEYEALRDKKKKEKEQKQELSIAKINKDLEKEGLCSIRKAIRFVHIVYCGYLFVMNACCIYL